jgi:LmbE family N-acetylglucosaminyl deacetylase
MSQEQLKHRALLMLVWLLTMVSVGFAADADTQPIRRGTIGLDTSHAVASTEDPNNPANKSGREVVANPASEPERTATKLRIVFLGAHCDDNEVCAGGLMRLLADQGHEVISAYATTFRRGRMVDGKPEDTVRRAESTAACKLLGATPHFFPYAHEDLEKPLANTKTLSEMAAWLRQIKPDIVLTQWIIDTHPNHRSVAEAVMAAYRHSGHVWGQESQTADKEGSGWNLYFYEANTFTKWDDLESLAFRPTHYLDVAKVHALKKQVVETFKSQAGYDLWNVQENMHQRRGAECGAKRAEAFFLVEAKPGCPLLPVPLLVPEQP